MILTQYPKIETVVQKTEGWGYILTDSAYVGLVVHIALAVQRLKTVRLLQLLQMLFNSIKDTQEYEAAGKMAEDLDSLLAIQIPYSEIGYITMHLFGSQGEKDYIQLLSIQMKSMNMCII
ncbi:hypothetical protein GCM10020331_088530 [Ectobacillus funiculus]